MLLARYKHYLKGIPKVRSGSVGARIRRAEHSPSLSVARGCRTEVRHPPIVIQTGDPCTAVQSCSPEITCHQKCSGRPGHVANARGKALPMTSTLEDQIRRSRRNL